MNRRTFAASAAVLFQPGRVRVGLIGSGGRGRYLSGEFKEIGAEMSAVCDVYQPNLEAGLRAASSGAKAFKDYRGLLDDKSIGAVIVAAPDHWHARMVIDAVQAGKDVYCEKPMTHTVAEALDVVAAVRQSKRVVQVGMQRRSFDLFQDAKRIMDSGQLGEIRLVTSIWLNNQAGISNARFQGDIDWKQWLGQAPAREPDSLRFFNWYYFYDYSGGLLVGQAAHIFDAIQWFMNSGPPSAVMCAGGKVNLPGVEIPETASVALEYPSNFLATFTIGYKAMRYAPFNDQLKQFHGDKARLDMARESYALYPASQEIEMKPAIDVRRPKSFNSATRMHIRNFLECVESRRDPNTTVEHGRDTRIALSMAMDSLRKGVRTRWNPAARRIEA
ncbi:MAG: Gfo/Idh/MocA family oxidoreductase [Bryobacterales bacterium]|nr:Gfo/Idh/MocA family oxidoreductase [Bryobacterales bacterium]